MTYWKRRVVEACIYGVDKNELAVELAKLSLWLETVAADKPLSFLDHHLRHGDSLIGARLKDLEGPPKPARPDRSRRPVRSGSGEASADPLFDESAFTTDAFRAVGGAARIEAILTDDLDAVHDKESILREIQDEHLARWRRLADLWVSAYFGNDMNAKEYADLALRIQGKPERFMSDEQAARYLEHPTATNNDYFHWELAFPEVFFDVYGRPKGEAAGFDAVVENPPYANAWAMTSLDNETRQAIEMLSPIRGLLSGHWDLYTAFIVQSLNLAHSNAYHAFIVPDALAREKYASSLREHLLSKKTIESIMHFEGVNVFDEVSRHCIIYTLRNNPPQTNSHTKVRIPLMDSSNVGEFGVISQSEWLNLEDYQIRLRLADEQVRKLIGVCPELCVNTFSGWRSHHNANRPSNRMAN